VPQWRWHPRHLYQTNTGGFGVADNAKYPKFHHKGENRELFVRYATQHSHGCPFGGNCNKFHLTKTKWKLNKAKQAEVAAFIAKAKNLNFIDCLIKPGGTDKGKGKNKAKKSKLKHGRDATVKESVQAIIIDENKTKEEEG
jgi:hypothetical protein